MKKYYLILIAVLAVQFAGCSGKGSEHNVSQKKETVPTEKVLAMNNVTPKAQEKSGTIKLNKAEFLKRVWDYEKNPNEWVYKGDKPSMIDFYADWCGPCRMMAPVMEDLAKEYKDKIYVYKIDTDVERELASIFGIKSLPTFLVIPMKDQPQMLSGAGNKEKFKKIIDEHMLKN